MSVTKREYRVLSSDGVHNLAGVVYLPEGEAKGFFQVAHGMTEHIGRYERFMQDMAEAGWICFGYDHLGHGHTVNDDSELGFIAKNGGWELLVKDIKVFSDAIIAEYSEGKEKLPYCLMGSIRSKSKTYWWCYLPGTNRSKSRQTSGFRSSLDYNLFS